ncbi:DUF4132 domain-containing protein [Glycomyces sp. NPDC048151]|uniref:DUF4132 domain-containing protein n=1 Tax=Glycomyces sp. NPDC048151 TaxID=3364002 RepID=UPI0037194327
MTESAAVQEDQLILPDEWAARVLPRRGNTVRRPVELPPEAAAHMAAQTEASRADLEAALRFEGGDPLRSAAGLAHLGGEPNPVGAAAVAVLLRYTERYNVVFSYGKEPALKGRELFAAWVAEHGLPFAVAAAVEDMCTEIDWEPARRSTSHGFPAIAESSVDAFTWNLWTDPEGPLLLARGLLAEASDDEYRRVVARVAAHRDTPLQRAAAAILLPDEHEWVADACRARRDFYSNPRIELAIWSLVSTAEHLGLWIYSLSPRYVNRGTVATIVANLGTGAFDLFTDALENGTRDAELRSLLYEAVALLPTDAAASYLIRHADRPEVLTGLKRAAELHPHRFARGIAAEGADADPSVRVRIAGLLRHSGHDLPEILKGLDDLERGVVEGILAEAAPPAATVADLPAALRSPAWAERKRRRAPAPVDGLETPEGTALVWAPGEREALLAKEPGFATWDDTAFWASDSDHGFGLAEHLRGRLARRGEAEVPAVLAKLATAPKYASALVPIRSREAAALAADWFARLKSARAHATDWLDRHREHAVPLLVPSAFGADKRQRDGGEAALRYLARRLGGDAVLEAAAPHGPEALARLRDLLATDIRVPFAAAPRTGEWADPLLLPPIMLCGNEQALPVETVRHFVSALALWTPRLPFPGVDDFAEACEPVSLQRFSIALFDLWIRSNSPSKDSWVVDQLGAFGGDDAVAALAPRIRTWPGQSQTERALLGLEVIAHIGTDAAFSELRALHLLDKFPSVTARAKVLADRLAAARGLDFEQLADRLAPDHGMTDPANLVFDYGKRRFSLRFDSLLTPQLRDDAGKLRPRLPKPGLRDDESVAKPAFLRWKQLVKNVEDTAEERVRLLEAQMISGRVFTREDLRVLDAHPITGAFTRRLLWFANGAGFRIAEDGGFADVDDRECDPGDVIRLAHPALLGDDTAAWIRIFADYMLIQPFDQLSRPAPAFTADELATGRLTRFEGFQGDFHTLGARFGWTELNDSPEGGDGWGWHLQRQLRGGHLIADVDPSPESYSPDYDLVHTVTNVRLQANRNRHPDHAKPLPARDLDPVTAAELLARLTGLATT